MNWAFTYANLEPYALDTPEAWLFLATNIPFFFVGNQMTTFGGNPTLGILTELAGTASCWYHLRQVQLGGNRQRGVQLALTLSEPCTEILVAGC